MKYEWCLYLCIIGHGLSSCVKIKFHNMCVWYIRYMIWHEIMSWMVYELTHVGKPDTWISVMLIHAYNAYAICVFG